MKVGFITPEYPHPEIGHSGGLGTSIKNLAIALVECSVSVFVFVYHQNEQKIIKSQGVEIHLVKTKRYSFFSWYFYRKYMQRYINKIIIDKHINILEAPDWTGVTAFMTFKVPLVIRLHGSDGYFCKLENRPQKIKNFIAEKRALKQAKAYIAPTHFSGVETQRIFNLRASKIKTIHYGLRLEDFQNENPNNFNENTILYLGTIIRKKGVFELAKIFNRIASLHTEARLILIGSDAPDIKTGHPSTFQLVEKMFSKEAEKRVLYLGKIPYKEVKAHVKNAHVCVFPSFAETLGMVTIESMALQKPVVNTSIGWGKELIEDSVSGYLVHPKDTNLYADRVLALLHDKDLCLSIGKSARKRVEARFDIKKQALKNIALYQDIQDDLSHS